VLYGGHENDSVLFVDLIEHPVHASPRRPGSSVERVEETLTEPVRVFQERRGDELVYRGRGLFRDTYRERARRRAGDL
jgi:hypothetical protein